MTSNPQRTILVVDDDRLVLATLASGLSQAGYHVLDADNGDDAILLAREHRPDLALLDIRMQGISGFDVAEYLRSKCLIPFMFLSAFADEHTAAKVRELGAVAYLVKPVEIGQILPVVAQALDRLGPPASAAAGPAHVEPEFAGVADVPVVWMAVGVLMHRYSLGRGAAAERLRHMADAEGLSVVAQAERMLDAVERLALPAQP
jgi:response regulator NasT